MAKKLPRLTLKGSTNFAIMGTSQLGWSESAVLYRALKRQVPRLELDLVFQALQRKNSAWLALASSRRSTIYSAKSAPWMGLNCVVPLPISHAVPCFAMSRTSLMSLKKPEGRIMVHGKSLCFKKSTTCSRASICGTLERGGCATKNRNKDKTAHFCSLCSACQVEVGVAVDFPHRWSPFKGTIPQT